MLGGSEDPDAPGAVFDDGKDVNLRAVEPWVPHNSVGLEPRIGL
jgi:hypothetical protein